MERKNHRDAAPETGTRLLGFPQMDESKTGLAGQFTAERRDGSASFRERGGCRSQVFAG
jgi:hypothetical protein